MGSLLSRARLLRERPLYPTEGLLRKARSLRGKITGRPPAGTESIDPLRQKEQEIMAEMDSILGQNRLAITDETLKFTALSSGARFPLLLNLAAAALTLVVGAGLFFIFNRGEATQVDPATRISSAESRIISAVREESRQELARKEEQINSINRRLREAEEARLALIAETENELLRREAQLKEELSRELEAERQRLLAAGLNDAELNERLSRYQEEQQGEYEERLAAVNAELEARLEERSAELNQQMEEYRQALGNAQSERESIQAELAAAQEKAALALEEADADRNAALARLEEFNRQQNQSALVEERLLSMYDAVNTQLEQREYREASLQLDRIEEFINSSAAETVMVLNNRMEVEQFLVDSLRRLISVETAETEEPSPFEPLLASISARVEEGNRLFSEGNLEEAGEAYTEALNAIPEIETGYARLQEIEERQLAQERSLLEERLAEGEQLYREARYQASVDRYREALEILERQAPPLDQLVAHLMDAGYQLGSENKAEPEPVIITEVIREEDRELIEKARAADERRSRLLKELEGIRTRLATGSGAEEAQASKVALISLLNTKLLIRQALASDEVRREYPDLYRNADAVFEVYGEERRREGRTEALRDMVAITDYLTDSPSTELPEKTAESVRQRELLLQFLENLEELLGGGLP